MNSGIKPAVALSTFNNIEENLFIEILKLYKIVLNSTKVKEIRNKFNLSKDEFIANFLRNEGVIIKKFPAQIQDKGKKIKTINGMDVTSLYTNSLGLVKEQILDEFQLAYLPLEFIMQVIFFLPLPAKRRRNELPIKRLIHFYSLGIDTKKLSFKNINTIKYFDEKFEFTRKYDDLRSTL